MPVTWITSLIGSLALIGTPFFSGFYSKESIIEAVKYAQVPGAGFAYVAVVAGVFVTAFYSFRMYFLVFHGKERWMQAWHAHNGHDAHDDHGDHHHGLGPNDRPHESRLVITLPLVLLAIPSVIIGAVAIEPMLFGDFFKGVITVLPSHPAMAEISGHFHGWVAMATHGVVTLPFWLAVGGVAFAYYCYLINPAVPAAIHAATGGINRLLENKYYMDRINEVVFAGGARLLGTSLWKAGDQVLIDGIAVNGPARLTGWIASLARLVQSGLIYHYAIAMIAGIAVLLCWFVPLVKRGADRAPHKVVC